VGPGDEFISGQNELFLFSPLFFNISNIGKGLKSTSTYRRNKNIFQKEKEKVKKNRKKNE
jgi:hypothetical protein